MCVCVCVRLCVCACMCVCVCVCVSLGHSAQRVGVGSLQRRLFLLLQDHLLELLFDQATGHRTCQSITATAHWGRDLWVMIKTMVNKQ